ncbi:MAG: hypothetical protein BMS9Abin34_188 [Patescibacteria group bacterium]|nr:MAG: hypothetical protein BMS9Abin34_188 [Patescibacteria group bacterium]
MQALVLSGGANFGALQAGALEVIFSKTEFRPELISGTSAGALNALLLASNPTLEGVKCLQELWRSAGPHEVGKPNLLSSAKRFAAHKDSILSNKLLEQFLLKSLPHVRTFGELTALCGVRAYATGVCLETSELRIFGDRDDDLLIDGAMSSSAMAPFLPPWQVGDYRYIDGGVFTKLPIFTAIERGATQVVALWIEDLKVRRDANGMLAYVNHSIALMTRWQVEREIHWARETGVPVRVFKLTVPPGVSLWDYSQSDRLIRLGRTLAKRELKKEPLKFHRSKWTVWTSQILKKILRSDRPKPV